MSIHPRDILFYGGGAALEKFGTLCQRRAPAFRGGEEVIETFTRTGTAYFKDRSGVLRYAEENAPRVHWLDLDDDGVMETPALLLEQARTNAWTYSEDLSDAAWGKQECTITANDTTAPDGASTADLVNPTAVDTTHYIQRSQTGLTDNTETSASFFAKQEDQNWVAISTVSKASTSATSFFNLATGAEGTQSGGHRTTIEPYGDGWYRISVAWDVESGGAIPLIRIIVCDADNDSTYLGVVGEGIYVWGIQTEDDKPNSSSYIATAAATATRNAEICSFPYPRSQEAQTTYVKFVEHGTALVSGAYLYNIGTGGDPRTLVLMSGGDYRMEHYTNAVNIAAAPSTAEVPGDTVESLGTINADGSISHSVSINAGAATTATNATTDAMDDSWGNPTIGVGCSGVGAPGFNPIIALIVARGAPTLADFRALLP